MFSFRKKICIFIFTFVITLLITTFSHANTNLQSSCYKTVNQNNFNYIIGISPSTSTNELFNNLLTEKKVEFYSDTNKLINDECIIKTGMYVKCNNTKYILVVTGDVNRDGKVSQTDLFQIRSHIVGLSKLSDDLLLASNVNADSKTSVTDILKLKQHLVNLIDIKDLYQNTNSNSQFEYTHFKLTNVIKIDKLKTFSKAINIPESIDNIPVVQLSNSFISTNSTVTTLTFSKNIQNIPIDSLQNCNILESISIDEQNSYYYTYDGILYSKDITSILYFPNNKNLSLYLVPKNIQSIGVKAFANAHSLKELIIPNTVSQIAPNSFGNGSTQIYLQKDSPLIEFCINNQIPYSLDSIPYIEKTSKSDGIVKTSNISFSATDDTGIIGWAIVKKGESVSKWNDVGVLKTLETTQSNITQNGTYTIFVKDLLEQISQKDVTISNIDSTPPEVTSIKIISPESGKYQFGIPVTIRVTFSEIVKGTAPTLTVNVGNVAGTGTMTAGTVSGTTNYIDYTYTTAEQGGIITIANYTGGSLTDIVSNKAIISKKENSGNTVEITVVELFEIAGRGVYFIMPIDQSITFLRGAFQGDRRLTGDDTVHEGVDIHQRVPDNWVPGVPVYAAASGTIIYRNRSNGRIHLDHGNGVRSEYIHLDGGIVTDILDTTYINQGELVGYTSQRGIINNSVAPHLHFGIMLNNINPKKPEEYYHVDPELYMRFDGTMYKEGYTPK